MTQEEIEALIRDCVKTDIYGDLYGVDRVAEYIAESFQTKDVVIQKLKQVILDNA